MNWIIKTSILFSAGFFFSCGLKNDSLAGGTSTETEAIILGTVSNPNGTPATGARIKIRPIDYLASTATDTLSNYQVLTDAQGKFKWSGKDTGLFNLEVSQGSSLGTLIRNVSLGHESKSLQGVLDSVGALKMSLANPDPSQTYTLKVYGMERYANTDSLGRFWVSLPAGDYRLIITGSLSPLSPLIVDSAHVDRAKESVLDSLRFPKLDSALIGYWPLGEGSGEVVGDASGNGYFGSLKGAKWTPGRLGGGIQFTQGQGYLDMGVPNPDVFNFAATTDFSFAAWAKLGNPIPNRGVARRIISKQKNQSYASFLRIFPDGRPGFASNPQKAAAKSSSQSAIGVGDLIAPISIADGAWHQLTAVQIKRHLYLYVDGKLRASSPAESLKSVNTFTDYNDHSQLLYPDPGLDGHLVIGCVESGIDGFDGSIDEVRIYGRGLTAQEVFLLWKN